MSLCLNFPRLRNCLDICSQTTLLDYFAIKGVLMGLSKKDIIPNSKILYPSLLGYISCTSRSTHITLKFDHFTQYSWKEGGLTSPYQPHHSNQFPMLDLNINLGQCRFIPVFPSKCRRWYLNSTRSLGWELNIIRVLELISIQKLIKPNCRNVLSMKLYYKYIVV